MPLPETDREIIQAVKIGAMPLSRAIAMAGEELKAVLVRERQQTIDCLLILLTRERNELAVMAKAA